MMYICWGLPYNKLHFLLVFEFGGQRCSVGIGIDGMEPSVHEPDLHLTNYFILQDDLAIADAVLSASSI